jgi:hypothetical protein
LERRFARLDECETVWLPKGEQPSDASGVFGHLKPKDAGVGVRPVDLPWVTMTWAKFSATVLPGAEAIELNVPNHGNFTAILTAEHGDAPLIFQWAHPISSYVYNGGSPASRWRLSAGWTKVTGIVPHPIHADAVIAVLAGACDTNTGQGNALFPETLKTELHAIRSTIEAYSKSAVISGREEASACGHVLSKGPIGVHLRVRSDGAWASYFIDRWD